MAGRWSENGRPAINIQRPPTTIDSGRPMTTSRTDPRGARHRTIRPDERTRSRGPRLRQFQGHPEGDHRRFRSSIVIGASSHPATIRKRRSVGISDKTARPDREENGLRGYWYRWPSACSRGWPSSECRCRLASPCPHAAGRRRPHAGSTTGSAATSRGLGGPGCLPS